MRNRNYRKYYRTLLRLGLPIMIGQLGMIVLSFADTMMVGLHGTDDLAAASFVNNLFNLVIIFATGFSYGLTPVVGSLFGRGEKEKIGCSLKNGLLANTLVALGLTAVMLVLYFYIHRLGQPEELLPLMRPYYIILLISLVPVLIFNAFKQFSDGITDTRTPMWILLTGNLINIVGNWILIYGKLGMPEMGLVGAGIATLFSRIFMMLLFIFIFLKKTGYAPYRRGFRHSSFERSELLRLNRLGMPVALQMGMETASFSLSTIMVGWLGTIALAAHQIMLTVGQLGFMMYYGMAAAVAILTSNFKGQGRQEAVRRSANAGFHLILLMAGAVSIFMLLFRNYIGGWFSEDTAVASTVTLLIVPFVIYQFGDGLQCNFSNALRGIADVKPVMLYAFIAYFVISLPAGYFFGFILEMGLPGIWLSFPFGLTSAGAMFYFRFRSKTKIQKS